MTHRNRALLDIAHEAPCMLRISRSCGAYPSVPCHSDMLRDGRGAGHKSHDALAVPGCPDCHLLFTRYYLGREGYEAKHREALAEYVVWLHVNGWLRVVKNPLAA